MQLIVLGSGTSVPHPRRASTAHWLETQHGTMLLDISADAPHRMAEEGLDWAGLDAIWISHFHLDHSGGLAPYLFGMRSAPQTQQRTKAMNIYAGTGFEHILRAFDDANNYKLFKQPFPLNVIELQPGAEFEILPELTARTFATPHTPESMALRLTTTEGQAMVYTSDTGYSAELAEFARGADLLVMECSFFKDKPVSTHLKLDEALQLARTAAPRKLLLTHLYEEWDGVDLVAEAKKLWQGETLEAYDGLRLQL
ncbi:MAG TPA: MBL fold metallo-hydrolase [Pyrinomonadaceae bacterium]|nr:MBL fold metallo-hydrolase [Pyrinomonadaceae bacterium]